MDPLRPAVRVLPQTAPVAAALERAGVHVVDSGPADAVVVVASEDVHATAGAVARAAAAECPVLVLVPRRAGAESTWLLVAAGAADVLESDEPAPAAAAIAGRIERWSAVEELVASPALRERLVGSSAGWGRIVRTLVEAAAFSDVPLLLTGESGTGKELAAHVVHLVDRRRQKAELVVLDCTTIVPTLSGSEFFGHERGAFTGAAAAREGAFGRADGGTLFLDEVAELEPHLQAELLRVIQEGTYKRVGSDAWRRTRFRLVCATNRDITADVAAGQFRADLYHRIAAARVHLPPLRERREDILPLARHFLAAAQPDTAPALDSAVEDFLLRRDYPGNVRELRHLVTRMALRRVGGGPLTVGAVPDDERPAAPPSAARDDAFVAAVRQRLDEGATLREIAAAAGDTAIALALADASGSVARAARRLGVTPRALQLRRARRPLPRALPADLELQPPTG